MLRKNNIRKIKSGAIKLRKEEKSDGYLSTVNSNSSQTPLHSSFAQQFMNQPYTMAGRFGWNDVRATAAWSYYKQVATVRDAVDTGANNYQTVPYGVMDTETGEIHSKVDPSIKATRVLSLLEDPNQDKTESEMKRCFYSSYSVTGNLFILATFTDTSEDPKELYYINSRAISFTTDAHNLVSSYQITSGPFIGTYYREEDLLNNRVTFVAEDKDLGVRQELWHIKTFAPEDMLGNPMGLSPLSSLFYELEQLVALSLNNNALLRNGMRPGLALTTHKPDGEFETLSEDQIQLIKESAVSLYGGPNNTGNVMILDGISQVTELALKNRDMQFLEMYRECIMQVYRNLNIPLPFVNQDSQTYSNYAEAKLSFYDMSIIPFATIVAEELDRFLMPYYDDTGRYKLVIYKEGIPIVEELRKEKEDQLRTLNERRAAIGLEPLDSNFITVGASPIQLSGPTPSPNNNDGDTNE